MDSISKQISWCSCSFADYSSQKKHAQEKKLSRTVHHQSNHIHASFVKIYSSRVSQNYVKVGVGVGVGVGWVYTIF